MKKILICITLLLLGAMASAVENKEEIKVDMWNGFPDNSIGAKDFVV